MKIEVVKDFTTTISKGNVIEVDTINLLNVPIDFYKEVKEVEQKEVKDKVVKEEVKEVKEVKKTSTKNKEK